MTKAELRWLAGWFDGRGSFFMGKGGTAAIIQVFSTDRDVIEHVAKLVGGNVYRIRARRHKQGFTTTEGWRLSLESEDAVSLMRKIHPLVGRRRSRIISKVLAAWKSRPNRPVEKLCACGCGRRLVGGPRRKYARSQTVNGSGACAKRAYRRRVSR